LAVFTLNSPGAILFPNVRLGTPDSLPVSISNTATAPAAGLGCDRLRGRRRDGCR
jgi:hypothetical protein